jgi:hypothetical protein
MVNRESERDRERERERERERGLSLKWAKAEADSLYKTCISQTFSAQCPEEKKVLK